MPGLIQPITGQLDPYPLARYVSYETTHDRPVALTEYPDGSSQRKSLTNSLKRTFTIVHRVQPWELATLKAFWKSHLARPFQFTDQLTAFSVPAVFIGGWSEQWQVNKYIVSLQVEEII
ncbi:MAG: hypothetical protein J0H49_10650 [Acidobacteria bacterium]|nr:hypothetical protein [Acidobacteriota bacterium]